MPSYCTSFVRLQIDDQTWNSISLVLFLFLSCGIFAKGTLLRNKSPFKAIFQTPNTALISLLISKESQRDRPTHPPKNNNLNKTIVKASRQFHVGRPSWHNHAPIEFSDTHTQPRLQVDASESIGRRPVNGMRSLGNASATETESETLQKQRLRSRLPSKFTEKLTADTFGILPLSMRQHNKYGIIIFDFHAVENVYISTIQENPTKTNKIQFPLSCFSPSSIAYFGLVSLLEPV